MPADGFGVSPLRLQRWRAVSRARATPRRVDRVDARRTALIFTHATCISCLILQRFGLTLPSGQVIFLATFSYPLLVIWLLTTKHARVSPVNFILYCVMFTAFLCSSLGGVLFPDLRMRFSLLSLGELLLIYTALLPGPADAFDTSVVMGVVVGYLRLIAVLGIVEWAAQFAGVRVFSFTPLAPALRPFLTESGYHVVAAIKYGSPVLRSNGFVLLEPSTLSQFMALGIVIELFVQRKLKFLPLYALAIFTSFSGTGLLGLALALLIAGALSPRYLPRVVLLVVLGVLSAATFAAAFPEQFASLAARASGQDASANLRYTAQLDVLSTIIGDARVVIGFGPGAAEGYSQAVVGSMSSGLKLFFDYGLVGIIAFAIFFARLLWRTNITIVSVLCLVVFQVGGGLLVFTPWIYMATLVCCWSRPTVHTVQGAQSIRRTLGRSAFRNLPLQGRPA